MLIKAIRFFRQTSGIIPQAFILVKYFLFIIPDLRIASLIAHHLLPVVFMLPDDFFS